MIEELDKRIKRLENEGQILFQSHQTTVRRAQEIISQNLNRIEQIKGGIAELNALKAQLEGKNNNDNSIPTASGRNRAAHVRAVG
jgi:SMC interacting uncharacterized protein involved in chromosome segregation